MALKGVYSPPTLPVGTQLEANDISDNRPHLSAVADQFRTLTGVADPA